MRLLEAIGETVRAIEHVGSTAVDGVPARPVVDIAIAVDSLEAATRHVPALQQLGYEYYGEEGIGERRFFRKREPVAYNLELLVYQGNHWRSRIALRDHLRRDAEAAEAFAAIKRELVEDSDVTSLEEYRERKRPLLEEWSERAVARTDGSSER